MKIEKPEIVKKENVFKYNGEPIKMTLGTIILTCVCVLLLIVATFTQLSFNHFIIPADFMNYLDSNEDFKLHFFKYYRYIPQVPVITFISAFLGKIFGAIAILVYIAIGLFVYPVFALGGGLKYIFEYNFGYILAYLPAVIVAAHILKKGFNVKNVLLAALTSVLIIHIFGVIYTLILGIFHNGSSAILLGWILAQSGLKIVYDFIFSVVAIVFAEGLKRLLWIVMC